MSPDKTPSKIGRYEIQRELGRGMMGVVYEARDPSLNRVIALKVVRFVFAVSDEERENFERRFLAEARIAARLSHPGLVVAHDIDRDPETGLLYIALEYLEGKTLAQLLNEAGPLPWREALRIAGLVAEALHYAHARGIVHRDIKPANIMVLPAGDVKVMDFGLAKQESHELTASGQLVGTPLFMAPEQVMGQPVDGRTDIFSLGSVLYTLLTGRRPFAADSVPRIMAKVAHQQPPPPSSLVAGLPEGLDALVARAMAKDRDERYPDGAALAEDVADLLAGRPPRHLKDWTPPARGEHTLVSTSEEEVSALLEGGLEEVSAPGVAPPADLPLRAASGAVPATTVPDAASASGRRVRPVRLLALGMLLVGLVAYALSVESPERLAGLLGLLPAEPSPPPPVAGRTTASSPPAGSSTSPPEAPASGSSEEPTGNVPEPGEAGLAGGAQGSTPPPVGSGGPPEDVATGAAADEGAPNPDEGPSEGVAPRGASAGAPGPGPAAGPTPSPKASGPAKTAPRKPEDGPTGQLSVRIEHRLKKGSVRLWLDDRLVLDQALDARARKKLLLFTVRQGVVQETLKVTPGRHELKVQVKWAGNSVTRQLSAAFKAGVARELEVEVSGGKLSLSWK